MRLICNCQNTSYSLQKSLSVELQSYILQAVPCTGRNNCSQLKQPELRIDVLFLVSIFRLYRGLKFSLEHNSARKNLFLRACFCLVSRLSLREMDQKFIFGGTIGYGDSYLVFLFRLFKIIRLHAILYDAAGEIRAHSGKGLAYC